ncbi:MAG: FKBP-type peptidyl-prolyl cis-trans isomerase [Gammaproteobacteria bacterium]|nr:FKBP-type peptidyl-prolyl cis-trans isomerase [Gammaproteobacteria bacterium]
MPEAINMHSLVLMHYTISLTNGSIIESSFDDEPIEINMGQGDITRGMELAIFGLKEGESQTLTLNADQGFGIRDEDNIHDMPLSDFPEDLPPRVGVTYSFESEDGDEIHGTVTGIKDDLATIDFNHPLANQQIIFTVEILGVNNARAKIS